MEREYDGVFTRSLGRVWGSSHAEELMWRVLESTQEVVQLVDEEGRVLYRKNGKQEGGAENELQPWIQFWDGQSQAAAAAAFAEAQSGQPARFEALSRAFDGTSKWWAVTITPVPNHTERVTRFLVSARDSSEQKQLRQEVQRVYEELEKLRSELVHVARVETLRILGPGLAHELKQPVAAIKSNAHYAAQALGASAEFDEIRAALADIVRDSDRASEVIDRFRACMQGASPLLELCDVDALVADVASLLRPEARKRNIDLDTQTDHAPTVYADRVLLQQLLLNLTSNAFEAVDRPAAVGRAVTIRTNRGTVGAIVSVEDRGALMSDDAFSRIEEPFNSSKADGSGFGLSICRHILALHGSQLHIERNSGGGLVFSFELSSAQPY